MIKIRCAVFMLLFIFASHAMAKAPADAYEYLQSQRNVPWALAYHNVLVQLSQESEGLLAAKNTIAKKLKKDKGDMELVIDESYFLAQLERTFTLCENDGIAYGDQPAIFKSRKQTNTKGGKNFFEEPMVLEEFLRLRRLIWSLGDWAKKTLPKHHYYKDTMAAISTAKKQGAVFSKKVPQLRGCAIVLK